MKHLKKEYKYYVASLSGGKDSVAMVLRLIEEGYPLTHCLFYDTGMEFQAVYNVIKYLEPILSQHGVKLVWLKPDTDFLMDMMIRPIKTRATGEYHYGMSWCGGPCRWRTKGKITTIHRFLDTLDGDYLQYLGIAADEPERIRNEEDLCYPLVEWGMKEADCLAYCYDHNINWKEHEFTPDLYQILDRVSCFCCCNKNTKELRNIYHFLPEYWELLKGMQSKIDRPFRSPSESHPDGISIFDFEQKFRDEDSQMNLFRDCGLQ